MELMRSLMEAMTRLNHRFEACSAGYHLSIDAELDTQPVHLTTRRRRYLGLPFAAIIVLPPL